jgi:hypothetical protein
MLGLVRFLYLLALALWLGEIVFFSFVVAPAIFGVLGAARAGPVVAAIFPRYYAIGAAAAAVALGCAALLGRRSGGGWWGGVFACLVVGLVATAWAGAVVHPRAQRLRVAIEAAGGAPGEDTAFRRAHRTAVALNAAALVAGVAALGASAAALR